MAKVEPNTHVVMKCAVGYKNDAGQEQELNIYRANVLVGYDNIIPAIEEKLLGTEEGDTFEIVIPKEQSLGAAHPIYAKILVESVRPATPEDIAAHLAKSCGGG